MASLNNNFGDVVYGEDTGDVNDCKLPPEEIAKREAKDGTLRITLGEASQKSTVETESGHEVELDEHFNL